jgi:hypothetical protein
MKKAIILCMLIIGMIADAQNQIITKPLQLSAVNKGFASDSVLVWGKDKIVKFVPKSSFAAGASTHITAGYNVTINGSGDVNNPYLINSSYPTNGISYSDNPFTAYCFIYPDRGFQYYKQKSPSNEGRSAQATYSDSSINYSLQTSESNGVNIGLELKFPKPISSYRTYTLPVSVNGNFADINGNITMSAGDQVQSDWNATSGLGSILNKPNILDYSTMTNDYLPKYSNGQLLNSPIKLSNYYNGAFNNVGISLGTNESSNSLEIGTTGSMWNQAGLRFSNLKNMYLKISDANADVIVKNSSSTQLAIASKNNNLIRTFNYSVIGGNQFNGYTPNNYVTNLPTSARITELASYGNYYIAADIVSGDIYKITGANTFTVIANNLGFSEKANIVFDSSGNFYMSNYIDGTIIKVTSEGVKTILGTVGPHPELIGISSIGTLYSLSGNNRIDKVTSTGVSSIFLSGSNINFFAVDKADCLILNSGLYLQRYTSSGALIEHYPLYSIDNGYIDASSGIFYGTRRLDSAIITINFTDRSLSYNANNSNSLSNSAMTYPSMRVEDTPELDFQVYNGTVIQTTSTGIYFSRVNNKLAQLSSSGDLTIDDVDTMYNPYIDSGIYTNHSGVIYSQGSVQSIEYATDKALITKGYLKSALLSKMDMSSIITINGTPVTAGGTYTITTSPNTTTTIPLASAFNNSSTTRTGVTGWSFNITAGKRYKVEIVGTYQTGVTTTGASIGIVTSSGAATVKGYLEGAISSSPVATNLKSTIRAVDASNTTASSFLTTTGVSVINTPHYIGGLFTLNCTTTGTASIQFGSEINTSNAQLDSDSLLIITEY